MSSFEKRKLGNWLRNINSTPTVGLIYSYLQELNISHSALRPVTPYTFQLQCLSIPVSTFLGRKHVVYTMEAQKMVVERTLGKKAILTYYQTNTSNFL